MKSKFLLNLFTLSGLVFFFASCAREQGSVSFENETLRKQSIEIENSKSTAASPATEVELNATAAASEEVVITENAKASNAFAKFNTVEKAENGKAVKTSIAEKIALKKISKKLSKVEQAQNGRGGLDSNLKLALILGVFALILIILGGISSIFWYLGVILLIVALLFFLFWLLDNV